MSLRLLLCLTAALSFAVQSFAAGAVPPVAVNATYDVYRDGLPVAVVRESFEKTGDRYRIVSESKPAGLLAFLLNTRVIIHSSGSVTGSGLRPEQFDYGRLDDASKNVSAEFDWTTQQVVLSFDGRRETLPLATGIQDRLSAMYQFMFLPGEPSSELAFQMTNGRKIENYRYQFSGTEQIETPVGRLESVRLVKEREADDNGVEVWLARDRGLFPVRLVIVEKDGTKFEQVITHLEIKNP
jgi:hypothetical protein